MYKDFHVTFGLVFFFIIINALIIINTVINHSVVTTHQNHDINSPEIRNIYFALRFYTRVNSSWET